MDQSFSPSFQQLDRLNVAFKALLHQDLLSFKVLVRSCKEIVNVQFTPADLPSLMVSCGIQIFSLAQISSWMGKSEFLKVLVKAGARIEDRDPIFGGTCLHWAVFGRQKEMALFLVFDLHADVDAKNKFGQKPVNIFASAVSEEEAPWDFLFPEWLTKATKHESPIKVFVRVANYYYIPSSSVGQEESKVKNIVALSHLPSFPKVMEKIHSSRYDETCKGGIHFFLLEVQRLFAEGKHFYRTNGAMKRLVKKMQSIYKREVTSPSSSSKQNLPKTSIPMNFTIKASLKEAERISTPEEYAQEFRVVNIDVSQGFCSRSSSYCFSFCKGSANSTASCILTAQLRLNAGLKVAVPVLVLNGTRVQTFAVPSEEAFEWNLVCRKGTNAVEVFLYFGKYFEPKTGTLRNVVSPSTPSSSTTTHNTPAGEVKQLYSHFIYLQ